MYLKFKNENEADLKIISVNHLLSLKKTGVASFDYTLSWALMESNHPPTDYESVALTE